MTASLTGIAARAAQPGLAKESITTSVPSAREDEPAATPTVSVIVCAYTERRWEHLCAAVASVVSQGLAPVEIIVCIDHNDALFERARERACA